VDKRGAVLEQEAGSGVMLLAKSGNQTPKVKKKKNRLPKETTLGLLILVFVLRVGRNLSGGGFGGFSPSRTGWR